MTYLLTACTAPVTNITGPIYRLIRGDKNNSEGGNQLDRHEETRKLFFAIFRIFTVAALILMTIPLIDDHLSGSLISLAQFLIHPYAASLSHAFMLGGLPLIEKVTDLFVKQQLIFTRDDVTDFATSFVFCYIAQLIDHAQNDGFLDRQYRHWSEAIANGFFPKK